MKHILLLLLSLTFLGSAYAQTPGEDLLKKVDLTFYLEAEPTIEDVGFDNPKSTWKIDYQLYLSDWAALEKIGRCGVRDENSKAYCAHTINKKLDKRVKKLSTLLAKGKYVQKQLAADPNRTISAPVDLSPLAIETFNQAAKIHDKNPVLVFFVKTSISTKNAARQKLKKKFMTEGLHFLKFYLADKTFDFFNISKLNFTLTIVKRPNGQLELRAGYTHFG